MKVYLFNQDFTKSKVAKFTKKTMREKLHRQ